MTWVRLSLAAALTVAAPSSGTGKDAFHSLTLVPAPAGTIRLEWQVAPDYQIDRYTIHITEHRNGEPPTAHGEKTIPGGATGWQSRKRESFDLATAIGFDIKSPLQWKDPAVLTPGHFYRFDITATGSEKITLAPFSHTEIISDIFLDGDEPNRPDIMGNPNAFLYLLYIFIASVFFIPLSLGIIALSSALTGIFAMARSGVSLPEALRLTTRIRHARYLSMYTFSLILVWLKSDSVPVFVRLWFSSASEADANALMTMLTEHRDVSRNRVVDKALARFPPSPPGS